jgi:predicted alpha-1,2-mannosidase
VKAPLGCLKAVAASSIFLAGCAGTPAPPAAPAVSPAVAPAPAPDPEPAVPAADTFASSFEADEPSPRWSSVVETDSQGRRRASGVRGPAPVGLAGSFLDEQVEVTANGENQPGREVKENLLDGDVQSKWLVRDRSAWVQFKLPAPRAAAQYALTSANDARERDPRDWKLQGSQDGRTWTTLDTRVDQAFGKRHQTQAYPLDNRTAYQHYRLEITRNAGAANLQLAEVQLAGPEPAREPGHSENRPPAGPEPAREPGHSDNRLPDRPQPAWGGSDMVTAIGKGPASAPAARSGVGFSGKRALQYAGSHVGSGRAFSSNRVFPVNIPVSAETRLSYLIFPELSDGDLRYPSTHAAVDLAFADGSYLSELQARDQHGFLLTARAQGQSKSLFPNQWNKKTVSLGAVAAGKVVRRILVAYDAPAGPTSFRGWVDDIQIGPPSAPPAVTGSLAPGSAGAPASATEGGFHPSELVLTTRGTHASGGFSRGNNIPATAVPAGFNFWTPVTNAGTLSWLYEYHRGNNADNRPALQAFAASHQPSPWMGDRQTFQVMPQAGAGPPSADRVARALPFSHDNEVARPHHYSVLFDNGLLAEIAPTDHAALFRFTFPGDAGSLIFDNVNNSGSLTLDPGNRALTATSDVRSGLSTGATRLYIHATFDRPVVASGMLPGGGGPNVTGYASFDTAAQRVVTMRIATSLISIEQARKNLALEIRPDDTFESVRDRARALWDQRLSVIEVRGASPDQLTTLYSNLYRLYLYPNSAFENTGSARRPVYRHAVQSATSMPDSGPTRTGAPVVAGKVYVNNGFWDTYRTTWAAYALLSPGLAGELIDGFVQQYRDGGWIARWSSPGYANLMTGTSSDVAFADAFVKGVTGFDAAAAYAAALKNATVAPPGANPNNTSVGRKGLATALYRGYTPSAVSEGVSWALEGYINDFGIAHMARVLAQRGPGSDAERARYREEHEYFLQRAQGYTHLFDGRVGFFQGRAADGTWKSSPAAYDPRVWGHDHDYTETNGWNFAFHVPHDGQGLANLYGGRRALARKLDAFFATPETAQHPGSYGGIIHEMVEARDVRLGQWGFSNQVSHHIPWMYSYVGQPAKTQQTVREVLSRLYLGSEIGQGYAGDEDNGETSAWYLFAALGFYPLQVGSPTYVIGSPLFAEATVNLENGKKLVVRAANQSPRNIYVQSLKLDGQPHPHTWLTHQQLADGAVLEFEMGPSPSAWGTGQADAPPSLTQGTAPPRPLQDLTGAGNATATGPAAAALLDDSSLTQAAVGPRLDMQLAAPAIATFYTLTSAEAEGADPGAWTLSGSVDGQTWTVLDQRRGQLFPWRRQARAFKIARPGNYAHYRLEATARAGRDVPVLAEVELLAPAS